MIKKIAELLSAKNIILKNVRVINLADFTRSKTLFALIGTDERGYNNLIFLRVARGKILLKDACNLAQISEQISQNLGVKIKKTMLFYCCEICSKSIKFFKENSWKLYDFV
jgi:hypothetical protein